MEIEEAISAALLAEGAGVWALWRAVSGRNGYLGDPDMLALVREAQAKLAAPAARNQTNAVAQTPVDVLPETPSPAWSPESGPKAYQQKRPRPRWGTRSKAAPPLRTPRVLAALHATRPGD